MPQEVIDFLIKSLGWSGVLSVFIIYLITQTPKIYSFMSSISNKNLENIKSALSQDGLDNNTRAILNQELSDNNFYRAMGFRATLEEREKIYRIYNILTGKVPYIYIYYSLDNLEIINNNIDLKYEATLWNWLRSILRLMSGIFCLIVSVFFIGYLFYKMIVNQDFVTEEFFLFFLAVIFIISGIITIPFYRKNLLNLLGQNIIYRKIHNITIP